MADEIERYISQKKRDAMPDSDFAGHGTDFPIPDQAHLDAAVKDMGRESPEYQASIKKRIKEIAKRKGLELPKSWQEEDSKGEERMAGAEVEQPTNFSFYAPFVRVADKQSDKREVVGKATRGTPIDTYNTVITYDASKKAFSRAKRIPLREMHQAKAVGKGLEWWGDDEAEDIFLHSYISRAADDTWTKVEEDILVGYSIKGRDAKYGTIVRDGKTVPAIIDYDLVEVSLVDNPSCPGCDIAIMRGDGIESVIASDEEVAEVLKIEQQTVVENKTPAQPATIERAGATISSATQDALHSARNSALGGLLVLLNTCPCDACTAASDALDPDDDGDIDWMSLNDTDGDSGSVSNSDDDMMERVERMVGQSMTAVYSRMQAYLGEFSRRQSETGALQNTIDTKTATLQSAIERVAGSLEQVANKAEVATQMDKVLSELETVKGLFERVAKTPLPGGPHTGRSAQKHLATDGSASPSAEEAPDILRQINQAGVQLTAQQQALLIAGSLKRM